MQISIRQEIPKDIADIHGLEAEAFGRSEEADLVDRLRDEGALWLSQVALSNDQLVGHAAYSLVEVTDRRKCLAFPRLGTDCRGTGSTRARHRGRLNSRRYRGREGRGLRSIVSGRASHLLCALRFSTGASAWIHLGLGQAGRPAPALYGACS